MSRKLSALTTIIFATQFSLAVNAGEKVDIKAGVAIDRGFGATALINDQFSIMLGNDGIAGDYIFKKGTFEKNVPFTWYVAGGGYNEWNDSFGARLPLGLNLNFEHDLHNWHAYSQVAPDIGFDNDDHDVKFGAQFAIGLRYSF
jgi:hypothetical protein